MTIQPKMTSRSRTKNAARYTCFFLLTVSVSFVAQSAEWKPLVSSIEADKMFIKSRIRYNLVTAAFGTVSANQVLVEEDKQVAKAVENLPRAQQLALLANKARQKR